MRMYQPALGALLLASLAPAAGAQGERREAGAAYDSPQAVFAAAQEMERASLSVRAHLDDQLSRRGIVKCAVTEGLGTFWIVPHLREFSTANPHTLVDLRCSTHSADVLRMEADVAIQLTRPDRPRRESG